MSKLPKWRRVLFWFGVATLLCAELFEFVLPHFITYDACGNKAYFFIIPFFAAALAFILSFFGSGWWRWALAVLAFAGSAFWFSQVALVASGC
jgi:uncharacterized membrane protein YbaN (DUF454 family)